MCMYISLHLAARARPLSTMCHYTVVYHIVLHHTILYDKLHYGPTNDNDNNSGVQGCGV